MHSIFVWTLGDVISLAVFGLIVVVLLVKSLMEWFEQSRCKHDGGANETQACDAICRKCGKNLGFIGTWRDRQKVEE